MSFTTTTYYTGCDVDRAGRGSKTLQNTKKTYKTMIEIFKLLLKVKNKL